jgi:endonuclease YncB( thermonuclease family)
LPEQDRPFESPAFIGTPREVKDLSALIPTDPLPKDYPYEDAYHLDTETTGLSPRAVTTEIAIFDPRGKGKHSVYALKHGQITSEGYWEDLDRGVVADAVERAGGKPRESAARRTVNLLGKEAPEVSPWFIERATGPDSQFYLHAQEEFDLPAYKKIVKKELGKITPGADIDVKEVHFSDFFEEFVNELEIDASHAGKDARAVVAHGVNFDFRRFGEILRAMEKSKVTTKSGTPIGNLIDRYERIVETAPATPASRGTLFESGRGLGAGKVIAAMGGDDWAPIFAWASRDPGSAKRHPVRDTLTLTRQLYEIVFQRKPAGLAQMDVLNTAREALEVTAHYSFTDNPLEHQSGKFIWDIVQRVAKREAISEDQKMFLGRLQHVEKALAEDAYYKNVLEARLYYEKGQKVRPGMESFRVVTAQGPRTVDQRAGEKVVPGTVYTTSAKGVPLEQNVALDLVDEWTKNRGVDINMKRFKDMAMNVPLEDLEKQFHSGLLEEDTIPRLMEAAPSFELPDRLLPKTGSRQVTEALGSMGFHKIPGGKAAVAAGAALAMVSLLVATSKTGGDDDIHNDIMGMPEAGLAPEFRKQTTDFGSGWQGIIQSIISPSLSLQDPRSIERRIEQFDRTIWQDPGRRAAMEADLKEREKRAQKELGLWSIAEAMPIHRPEMFEGINQFSDVKLYSKEINPDKYHFEFDDADTLVVQRRGVFGKAGAGPKYSIRLAGIDAPEVGGHEDDPLGPVRIAQNQPFGGRSTEEFKRILESQESLTLVFNPQQTTYGRHIGVLYGDQMQNINMQLVKQGLAAYLPYGEAGSSIIDRPEFEAAEVAATGSRRGMWGEPFWQTYKPMAEAAGMSVTFNTLTRMDRLAKDNYMAEGMVKMWEAHDRGFMSEDYVHEATAAGNRLRYTHGRFGKHNKKRFWKQVEKSGVAGDQTLYNTVPGMQENSGFGTANRPFYGFGSGAMGRGFSHLASVFLEKGAAVSDRSISDLVQLVIRGDKTLKKGPSEIVYDAYSKLGEPMTPTLRATQSTASVAESRVIAETMYTYSKDIDLTARGPLPKPQVPMANAGLAKLEPHRQLSTDVLLEKYYRLMKNQAKRDAAVVDPYLESWANKVLSGVKAKTIKPQTDAMAAMKLPKTGGVDVPAEAVVHSTRNKTALPAQAQATINKQPKKKMKRQVMQVANTVDAQMQLADHSRHVNRSLKRAKC